MGKHTQRLNKVADMLNKKTDDKVTVIYKNKKPIKDKRGNEYKEYLQVETSFKNNTYVAHLVQTANDFEVKEFMDDCLEEIKRAVSELKNA